VAQELERSLGVDHAAADGLVLEGANAVGAVGGTAENLDFSVTGGPSTEYAAAIGLARSLPGDGGLTGTPWGLDFLKGRT
jgi:hypothetical protein